VIYSSLVRGCFQCVEIWFPTLRDRSEQFKTHPLSTVSLILRPGTRTQHTILVSKSAILLTYGVNLSLILLLPYFNTLVASVDKSSRYKKCVEKKLYANCIKNCVDFSTLMTVYQCPDLLSRNCRVA